METPSPKKSVKRPEKIKSPDVSTNKRSPMKPITSPKVNVFQFMMDSRHKVIGSNSPGKEKKPEKAQNSEEMAEVKQKLHKRKEIFAEWSDKKGGLKRKLTEEAQEKRIKDTMFSRGKRLKQMLEIIDESLRNSSHDEDESDEDIKGAKTHPQVNEKTNDNINIEELKINDNSKFNEKLADKNGTTNTKVNKTCACDKLQKSKSKHGSNKNLILESDESNNEVIGTKKGEIHPRSKTKNDKSFKNSKKSENKSLIIIKDDKNGNESMDVNVDAKEDEETREVDTNSTTGKEHGVKGIKNKKLDVKSEEKCDNNEADTLAAQINHNIVVEALKKYDEKVEVPNDSKLKRKTRTNSLSLKKSNDSNVSSELEKEIKIIDDSDEEIFPSRSQAPKTPLSSKNTRQVKLFNDTSEKNVEVFSPRTWRMKVRLFEKENVNNENKSSDTDESVIVIDDKDTPKKVQGKISNFFTVQSSSSSVNSDSQKLVKIAPLFVRQPKKTKAEIESKKNFLYSGIPDHMKRTITKQKR